MGGSLNITSVNTQLKLQSNTIIALAKGFTPEQARWKPDQENWSVLGVLNHLVDEEINDFRKHLNHTLLPQEKSLGGEKQYNDQDLDEALAVFRTEREKSIAWLVSLIAPDWDKKIVFPWGTLTTGDMLVSWLAHDLLHMRQLVELQYMLNKLTYEPYSVEYAGKW